MGIDFIGIDFVKPVDKICGKKWWDRFMWKIFMLFSKNKRWKLIL